MRQHQLYHANFYALILFSKTRSIRIAFEAHLRLGFQLRCNVENEW